MAKDGTIKINTELDSSKAQSAMAKFSGTAKNALKGITVAAGAAGTAITAMAGYAVKVGSDFEAGMSKVSAISGATGADFEKLSDKAKEMGAKTKFSAAEAASAFEYMAMAGWKTEDMLSGIEGVMDLAAASGESLAVTSDIVTDALTAFGMSAEESGHFADVLAAASSNANTNVSMMGETFKYVAPVAGALGFSAEDTAVAIGLMANSGIKAGQAGTSLRSIMTRLAKPTDEVAIAMDELGISITNSDGSMKSLNEIMGDLRSGFAGLSEAEKTNMAATIGGQEAMSGLLAIVNASDGDFRKLQTSIYSCDGAAKGMAETMQNNLKGSLTILGSAAEGFGIKVYEKMQVPLRKAVDAGTEGVNRLSKAFDSGGLKGVVSEAGKLFHELTEEIEGSSESAGKIVPPLRNIANVGLSLGKTVIPPAAKAFKLLAENLDKVVPLLVTGVTAVKAYTVATSAASAVKKLSTAYTASAMALDLFIAANGTSAVATAASTGAVTLKQIAVGVLSKQLGIATAAHAAFNAVVSANPIGLAVTAVAALMAGLIAYTVITKESTDAEREHAQELKNLKAVAEEDFNIAKERSQSYEELISTQNRQAAADINQLNNLKRLNDELKTLVDENGNVKKGETDRAAFITSQLSNALGIEISMTGEQIFNYQELQAEIQNLIQQKRIDAVMSAQQAKYEEAVARQMEVAADTAKNLTAIKKAEANVDKEKLALKTLQEEYTRASIVGNNLQIESLKEKIKKQEENVSAVESALKKEKDAYKENTELLAQYASDIDMYTSLAEAATSGNAEAIENAIVRITAGIKTAGNATREELQKQVISVAETEDLIRQKVVEGTPGFTESMQSQAQEAVKAALEEFAKAAPQTASELAKVPSEAIGALVAGDMRGLLSAEASGAVEGILDQFDELETETQDAFVKAIYGALNGLEGFDQVKDPAKEGAEAFLESLKVALDEHSPSKATEEIFHLAMEGAVQGVDAGKESVLSKAGEFVTAFLGKFTESNVEATLQDIGFKFMSFFGNGVSSQQENARNAGKANADAANAGAGSVNPTGTGSKFGTMLGSGVASTAGHLQQMGINISNSANAGAGSVNPTGTGNKFGTMLGNGVSSTAGLLRGYGTNIANSADSGAGSVNPSSTGSKFGSQYANGVGSQAGNANAQGRNLSNNAESGAGSRTGYDSGSNFGAGFVNGIGQWLGRAANAAANLALSAYNALKRNLAERSPSRKTKKSGKNFDLGFGLGIEENAKTAVSAAEELSKNTLDAIDTDMISDRLNNIDIPGTMARVHMAVEDRNEKVAEKVTASVAAYEKLKGDRNQNTSVTKEDMRSLLSDISRLTIKEIAETMEGMGVYLDKKPVGKIIAPVVDDELGKINRRKT